MYYQLLYGELRDDTCAVGNQKKYKCELKSMPRNAASSTQNHPPHPTPNVEHTNMTETYTTPQLQGMTFHADLVENTMLLSLDREVI